MRSNHERFRGPASARPKTPIAPHLMFTVAVGFALIMNGSVAQPYTAFAQIVLTIVAVPIVIAHKQDYCRLGLARRTLIAHTILLTWCIIQITPLPLGIAHPVWTETADMIEVQRTTLSVNPAETLAALPQILLPGLVFVTALLLPATDRGARALWLWLSGLGVCLVATAFVLETVFPELHVFASRPVSFGSFSGFLVNRNHAAALFVLVAFALAGSVLILRANRTQSGDRGSRLAIQTALLVVLFLIAIAVIATRSRAGTLMGLSALGVASALAFSLNQMTIGDFRKPLILVLLGVGVTSALLILFGEPVLGRLEQSDDARLCAWASTWEAIRDNPIMGTGLGTFAEVWPAYRDPLCLGTSGIWDYAHSTILELLLELGLIAIPILVWITYETVAVCIAGVRNRYRLRGLPALLTGIIVYLAGHSLVDFPLQIPGIATYAAALLGAGASICLYKTPDRPSRRARQDR